MLPVTGSGFGSSVSRLTIVDAVPTFVFAGQESALSWETEQKGAAFGSPTSPGGSPIVRSLVVPPRLMWTLKSLWAPALRFVGAAVPETLMAWAEAGVNATMQAANASSPARRLRRTLIGVCLSP